jgi:WD40 repeat protein
MRCVRVKKAGFCFCFRAVHVTKFLADKTRIFSGSDDNSVSVWDIPSEKELLSYREHQVSLLGNQFISEMFFP